MEKLKIGVIGVGTMGIQHLNVFATMSETTVAGIADLNLEAAQKAAAQYPGDIKCYTDYNKMISELKPDAVVISLPDSMHRAPVIAALAAGAHVMVEKPLATTLKDADYMIDFAKKCGKTLMVNYSHRWVAAYYKAWETIRSGSVGQVAMAYTKKDDPITVPKDGRGWRSQLLRHFCPVMIST